MPRPSRPEIDLLDGHFYAGDAHRHFAWMRAHAPVYWDEKNRLWGITRHDDILRLSKTPDVFCNRHGQRPDSPPLPSMVNLDDPEHMKRRNLVNRGFTPRRVADHEPHIREICVGLIENAATKGRFDFVREIAAPLPMIVVGDMLGVPPEERATLLRWSEDMVAGLSTNAPASVLQRARDALAEYTSHCARVVASRRSDPGDDLMSILVHAEVDGEQLDDDALLHESLLLLIGGDETTRHVISGGMHQLLLHPEQHHKLAAAPDRIPMAVEEMLRWVSPIQNMNRTALSDAEVRGEKIRAGDKLLLLYPSGNRDEAVFDDPFRFDVERRPNDHLAFGGFGTHFCLGASLARLELRVMFEELLRRLPGLELASDAEPPRRPSNFVSGIESLVVCLA